MSRDDKQNLQEEHVEGSGRRNFLGMLLGTAAAAVFADKAQAQYSSGERKQRPDKVSPKRDCYLVPFGAQSINNFHRRCIGCHLCVSSCPSRVLNLKASHIITKAKYGLLNINQPAMSFEKGWCRPECVKCSNVCPTGAIAPISASIKTSIKIGTAVWHRDRCRNAKGQPCTACQKNCPNGAVSVVPLESDKSKRQVVIDTERCIGCGACEYICPSRPEPAICVNGLEMHRSV